MRLDLAEGWRLASCPADRYATPVELEQGLDDWIAAPVPGTVAQALRAADAWSFDKPRDFDEDDWWYRLDFDLPQSADDRSLALRFDGLATICEIWLNGARVGESNNMFLPLELAASALQPVANRLYLRFRSLRQALAVKKPRPRWKTNLVASQNLRFVRSSLLGRIPGWSPPVAPVGPWRPVSVFDSRQPRDLRVDARLDDAKGVVDLSFRLPRDGAEAPPALLEIGSAGVALDVATDGDRYLYRGHLEIDDVDPWWPHSHGEPRLYAAGLRIGRQDFDLNPIGFRRIDVDRSDGGFELSLNGERIFCRGACWGVEDIVSLSDDESRLRATLDLVRRAGANMLRIGGTMTYESSNFYRICDEFGILVWQDFQFACMDYPTDDESFVKSVRAELAGQLRRQMAHACVVVHCGGSEIEQQPAMMGVDKDLVASLELVRLARDAHREAGCRTVFADSSPTGGDLPIDTNRGVAHYFGVGAYLADPSMLRRHDVRFAAECLGFANLPCKRSRDRLFSGNRTVTHHPLWKARTPRDASTGWDFEDVRDHYLRFRFGIDPLRLRWQEPERYLRLSEVVSAEIMSRAMQEWRSAYSNCNGALVWLLKDLWPGAGWGVIDADGLPKAAYYLLKQAWQPVALAITDESLNGLHLHLVNDTRSELSGSIRLTLVKNGNTRVAQESLPVTVAAATTHTIASASIMRGFFDITHSYKFGPPAQDLAQVEFFDDDGRLVCDNTYFHDGREVFSHPDTEVNVVSREIAAGEIELEISSSHFLYRVCLDAPGYLPEDNYFNLMPAASRVVRMLPTVDCSGRFRGYLGALNLDQELRIA